MSRGLGAAGLVDADDLEGGRRRDIQQRTKLRPARWLVETGAIDASAEVVRRDGRGAANARRVGDGAQHSTRSAARAREARAGWWPARRRRDAPIPVGRSRDRYYYRARAAASVSRCLREARLARVGRRTDAAETVDGDLHLSLGDGVDGGGLTKEGRGGSTGQPGRSRRGDRKADCDTGIAGVHVDLDAP